MAIHVTTTNQQQPQVLSSRHPEADGTGVNDLLQVLDVVPWMDMGETHGM